jgi:uncharacterized protein YuzE
MKIKYSKEADIILIEIREGTPNDSIDLKEGAILHLDGEGLPFELETLDASKKIVKLEENKYCRSFRIQKKSKM